MVAAETTPILHSLAAVLVTSALISGNLAGPPSGSAPLRARPAATIETRRAGAGAGLGERAQCYRARPFSAAARGCVAHAGALANGRADCRTAKGTRRHRLSELERQRAFALLFSCYMQQAASGHH